MERNFSAGQEQRRQSKGAELARDIREELEFHCEMLAEEFRGRGLSEAEVSAAAARRFGNIERVQAQCVAICKRGRTAVKLLKLLFLLSFMAGVGLRIWGPDYHVTQVGNVLMACAALGQLLVYLKINARTGLSRARHGSTLTLLDCRPSSTIEAFDEQGRTPVERLVADKLQRKF
jgi:hypothetical protein